MYTTVPLHFQLKQENVRSSTNFSCKGERVDVENLVKSWFDTNFQNCADESYQQANVNFSLKVQSKQAAFEVYTNYYKIKFKA